MAKSKKDAISASEGVLSSQPLSEKEFNEYVDKYWKPHVGELLRKDMEFALSDARGADTARARILDRLAGKPVERQIVEEKRSITINIERFDPNSERELLEKVVVEGEIGSLVSESRETLALLPPEGAIEGEYEELSVEDNDLDGEIHL